MAEMATADRVQEQSTTVGVGSYALGGAVSGYQTFLDAYGTGTTSNVPYAAVEDGGDWEVGIGTYSSFSNTLQRDEIIVTSQGATAVNWAAGTRNVYVTHPAGEAMFKRENLDGLADTDEALDNLGAGATGKAVLATTTASAARTAIGAVNVAGDTMTGDLTVQGEVSSDRLHATDVGNDALELDCGLPRTVTHSTTDGSMRYAIQVNGTSGNSPILQDGGDWAMKMGFLNGRLSFEVFDGTAGADNDPITWSEVFAVSPSALRWNGSQVINAGDKALFLQSAAPTGWTQDASLNDRVLRVVSGTGGGTGGSWTVSGLSTSTTVNGHTLTTSEIPAHTHTKGYTGTATTGSLSAGSSVFVAHAFESGMAAVQTNSAGSGGSHSHTASSTTTSNASWRPSYVDVIACTKD